MGRAAQNLAAGALAVDGGHLCTPVRDRLDLRVRASRLGQTQDRKLLQVLGQHIGARLLGRAKIAAQFLRAVGLEAPGSGPGRTRRAQGRDERPETSLASGPPMKGGGAERRAAAVTEISSDSAGALG